MNRRWTVGRFADTKVRKYLELIYMSYDLRPDVRVLTEVEESGVTDRANTNGSSTMLSLRSPFLDSVCSNIAAHRDAYSQMLLPLDGLREFMIIL